MSGYVTGTEYIYRCFPDWMPTNLTLACLTKGIKSPPIKTACELGFGQGVTLNLLASATDQRWYGTDFDTSQAEFARKISEDSNNHASIYNLSFADYSELEDLPEFDLIVLHGIYSWISEENQHIIRQFIQKRLSKNGLVYISYNAKPGTDSVKPIKQLLDQLRPFFPETLATPEQKVKFFLQWFEQFHITNPSYLKAFPGILPKLEHFKRKDSRYVLHELFNEHWHSFSFSEMAEELTPLNIKYLGQSRFDNELEVLNYSEQQVEFSKNLPSPLREDIQDLMLNRSFRRDIWVKNPEPLNNYDIEQFFQSNNIMLSLPVDSIDYSIKGAYTSAELNSDYYRHIIDSLSDYQPKRIALFQTELGVNSITMLEILRLLNSKQIVNLTQPKHTTESSILKAQQYNQVVLNNLFHDGNTNVLALPLVGSCIMLSLNELALCYSYTKAKNDINHSVNTLIQLYKDKGLQLKSSEQVPLNLQQETDYFTQLVEGFDLKLLPFLKAHKVL